MKVIYILPLFVSVVIIGCSNNNTKDVEVKNNSNKVTKISESVEKLKITDYVSPLDDNAPTYSVSMISYAPFKMKDKFGRAIGYDVDLIRAVGEAASFKVEIEEVPFSEIFVGVQDGSKDLAMSGLSLIPERQKIMAHSRPYSKGRPGFLVTEKSPNKDKNKLKDKRISVLEGSSLHGMLANETAVKLVLEPSMFLSVQDIFTDNSDAVFGMEPALIHASTQFPNTPSVFVPYEEPIMTVVYSNYGHEALIEKVNTGFDKIIANGRYHEINKKWFGKNAKRIAVN